MNSALDWLNEPSASRGIMDPSSPDFASWGQPNSSGGGPGGWGGMDISEKLGVVGQGVSAFSTLAEIYAGFKGMKLAKDQFKFQKSAWNQNFNAQVKDYNNQLQDQYAHRSAMAAANNRSFDTGGNWLSSRQQTPATGG